MMAHNDVFDDRLLGPEFSEKRLGLGQFADVLSQRSLSTSTPCVPRHVSSSKASEEDSGYVDSFTDSLWPSAAKLFNTDDIVMETAVSHQSSVNLHSETVCLPFDSAIATTTDSIFAESDFTPDLSRQIVKPPKLRLIESISEYPCIEEDKSFEDSHCSANSSLNVSGLADRFAEILRHFSPVEPDRIIGRKMLLEKVDIIGELATRNLNYSCISTILGYLDTQDLCRMCQVNRQWKQACYGDHVSYKRIKQFMQRSKSSKQAGKENYINRKSARRARGFTSTASSPLKAVQLVGSLSSSVTEDQIFTPVQNTATKRQLFDQAAKSLQNDESLCVCPKCQCPARKDPTQQRARCFNAPCSFDFCVKCQCEFHWGSPCVPVSVKKSKADSIGSKKSKKNLQRLLRRV